MEIKTTSIYHGPSIYSQNPVIHFGLSGLEDLSRDDVDQTLLDSLCLHLPGLRTHMTACNEATLSEAEKMGLKLRVNHVFEHVCIELQLLAGNMVSCIRTAKNDQLGISEATVHYEEAAVCTAAAELACDLIRSMLPSEVPADMETTVFDFPMKLDDFITRAQRRMLPAQDREMVRAARARGIPVNRLVGRLLILGQGRYQQRLSGTQTTLTNAVGNHIAANKDYARRVLDELGLPSPRYERVTRSRDAVAAAKRIGFPVVVKPNNGSMGRAVSVGMETAREVRAAYKRARELGRSVLIEELVEGADFRMMVINGKLCAASQRIPGHIVGDGNHTIEELVAEVNSDPRRGEGPKYSWTRIALDDQADRLLARLEYTRDSIPLKDEVVYLRRNANTSSGGTAIDVTDKVHPDNRAIAVRAAKAIGLDIVGVDLLTEDISRSIWDNGGAICEINSRPGLRKHIWPAEGKPRDVLGPIMDMLFPAGAPSRIKLVAITGTSATNRAATARLLTQMLADQGCCVGLATEGRVYIDGAVTGADKLSSLEAARMILLDPDVDTGVLEVVPEDVVLNGLGFDVCDVCAIVEAIEAPSAADIDTDKLNEAIQVVAQAAHQIILINSENWSNHDPEVASGAAQICRALAGETTLQNASAPAHGGNGRSLRNNLMAISSRFRQKDASRHKSP